MAEKVKTIEPAVSPERSWQSDRITHVGAGILPDQRGGDSLTRCSSVVDNLSNTANALLSKVEKDRVRELLSEDALRGIVMVYWDNHDHDRRTKNSDLKRELNKVVTHLRLLNKSMRKVPRQTADIVNHLIQKQKLPGAPKVDVFTMALQANALLLDHCAPLIEGKHGKTSYVSVVNLAAAMIIIWERLTGEKFKANTRTIKVNTKRAVTKDLYEFQGRGPHFVHVMMQAIDPAITQSKVASSIKALGGGSGRKTDL